MLQLRTVLHPVVEVGEPFHSMDRVLGQMAGSGLRFGPMELIQAKLGMPTPSFTLKSVPLIISPVFQVIRAFGESCLTNGK